MRWTSKEMPEEGEKRVINIFLFFPRLIGEEWRWLERVQILQVYEKDVDYEGTRFSCWEDKKWINK